MEPAPTELGLPPGAPIPPSAAVPTKTLTPSTNPSSSYPAVRIGTRRSKLARVQTDIVLEALQKAWPERTYEVVAMDPLGDRDKNTPLYAMGAKSLWTAELEVLLEHGMETRGKEGQKADGLDIIVHSAKGEPDEPRECFQRPC